MAEPTGKIIARPMVTRACGHLQEFQHYAVDKYRAQRLAKFVRSRCAACVEKLNEQQRREAALLPKKGEALQALPQGAQITLTRNSDGAWVGNLVAEGSTVEATGSEPQGVTIMLARQWLAGRNRS